MMCDTEPKTQTDENKQCRRMNGLILCGVQQEWVQDKHRTHGSDPHQQSGARAAVCTLPFQLAPAHLVGLVEGLVPVTQVLQATMFHFGLVGRQQDPARMTERGTYGSGR